MMNGVTFEPASLNDVLYVFLNARQYDKDELKIQGVTEENINHRIRLLSEVVCGKYNGIPVAIFGYVDLIRQLQFVFFATPAVNDFWKTATKYARIYFQNRLDLHFPATGFVEVWEHHRESLVWLKRLGFRRDNKVIVQTSRGNLHWMTITAQTARSPK
jgi:hypothetical protein